MYRLTLMICLVLAACAPSGTSPGSVFRDASTPVYSSAALDIARLDGAWFQVASFGGASESSCGSGKADFSTAAGSGKLRYDLCLGGEKFAGAGPISATGPGRFGVSGKDQIGQDWWVLWVDESYRTMAIGAPSGRFGFILNRDPVLPADRFKAAREVFDFNGYDVGKLQSFGG
jgi:apolipoprotein D and lipocalin family protein